LEYLFEVVDLINNADVSDVGCYDNGDGRIRLVNNIGGSISLEIGSPGGILGIANASYEPGNSIKLGNSLSTIQGAVVDQTASIVTSGHQFSINGETIALTGTTLDDVVDDITATNIPNITAFKIYAGPGINDYKLSISTSDIDITIANISGTALTNLGLTAGTFDSLRSVELRGGVSGIPDAVYYTGSVVKINGITITLSSGFNVASAVYDITAANVPDVFAFNDGGALRLVTSQPTINLTDVSTTGPAGAFLSLGMLTNDIGVLTTVETLGIVDDAVRDVNTIATGVANPVVTVGQTIVINGVTVMFTSGTGTLGDVINDISRYTLPDVSVTKTFDNKLGFVTETTHVTLSEGNGTALDDLGFAPGSSFNNIRSVELMDFLVDTRSAVNIARLSL
jgi:hypothetical protein